MMRSEAIQDTEVEVTGLSAGMRPLSIEALARTLGAAVTRRAVAADAGATPTPITGMSTDSRTIRPGDCFFAIAGQNFDGHDYVGEVFRKGAACAVVSRAINDEPVTGPVLRVPDTIRALGNLAREYRRMAGFTVLAVTGSVGKTTTRQIGHHVLSRRFRTHQAQKSFNNNIGLPLTLLGAGLQDEIVVAELGANHPGEIEELTRIAEPNIAVVTNAHLAHLEGFGDLATIIREKLAIAEGLPAEGTFLVNGDIEPLVAACRGIGRPFLTFGTSPGTDYRAETVCCEALHSTFVIRGTPVHLPLPGPGNVENALAAWAACDQLGVSAGEFAQAVVSLRSISMRAEPVQIGALTVLNDCYNANPASMKNALAMLANLRSACEAGQNRRLVFLCGEMAELGPQTESLHAELGVAAAEAGVDLLVTIGGPPQITARAACEAAKHNLQTIAFDDAPAACDRMQEFVRPDDILLIKGSRTARLERVVERLMKDYG
jgi:UDP-N-acetylmuramoyl-tripeptide--D-alanyl-D-alanine ligase